MNEEKQKRKYLSTIIHGCRKTSCNSPLLAAARVGMMPK